MQANNPSDTLLNSFLERVDDYLGLRFVEIDKAMVVEFSWFYHRAIKNLSFENV